MFYIFSSSLIIFFDFEQEEEKKANSKICDKNWKGDQEVWWSEMIYILP